MENNTETIKEKQSQNILPEAPASANVRIKSPAGFEYQFTLRDEKASVLMFKIYAMEKKWLSLGWTPLAQQAPRGGFPPKQIDYVPNRTCPTDGARLVRSTTKDGRKLIKCENNKWNFQLKRAEGCPFTEWEQPRMQPNPVGPVIQPHEVAEFDRYDRDKYGDY